LINLSQGRSLGHHDLEPLLNEIVPGGQNLRMRHLKAFLNLGIKRGYLKENPISQPDFVKPSSKEVEVISPEDIQKMLETALVRNLDLLP